LSEMDICAANLNRTQNVPKSLTISISMHRIVSAGQRLGEKN
jgi:hypothetical protein